MKNILVALMGVACSFPAVVLAELNYDAISIGYGKISESGHPDVSERVLGITKSVTNHVYVGGGYERYTHPAEVISGYTQPPETSSGIVLGVGYHTPLRDNADLIFQGNLHNTILAVMFKFSAGIKAELLPQITAGVEASYFEGGGILGGSITGNDLNVSLGYKITPQFELIAEMGSSSYSNHSAYDPNHSQRMVKFKVNIYY